MVVVDRGAGVPVVLIPGIQGRWEWMQATVAAVAERCRAITFSYADEPSTRAARFDPSRGFDAYVDQVAEVLDQLGLERAVICGLSYGGLIAAAFAARYPGRVSALVLASPVPPSWAPNERVRFYLRAPRLLTPLFCVGSLRMYPEIAAAVPGRVRGARAAAGLAVLALSHLFSPVRMARRTAMLPSEVQRAGIAALRVPTLVVTGEAGLDRVVPVSESQEYLRLWPHARHVTLARTGHLGAVTKAREFAGLVATFAAEAPQAPERKVRV
jgi:pimeloyl-ACP methyl ester carboxylesterase